MKSRHKKLLIGSVIVLAIFAYMIHAGMKGATLYYMTVSELVSKGSGIYEKGMRVSGDVETGSMRWDPQTLQLRFVMTDGSGRVDVAYQGGLPDTFREGSPVVVEGTYDGGTFQATVLLAKCPSKYAPAAEARTE